MRSKPRGDRLPNRATTPVSCLPPDRVLLPPDKKRNGIRGRDQRTFGCDRCDEDSDRGPDERGRVSDGAKALALDERGDLLGEGPEVCLYVVLEDEAGERARRLVLSRHLGEHVDEVRIEVRVTVELLQLLLHGALCA